MKEFSATSRCLHGRGDPPQAQALQRGILSHRPQKTASWNIDHAIDECRLMNMRPPDRQVAVGQAGCAHKAGLFEFAAASVEPNAFIAAERAQAKFATDQQMSRMA